jgi:hypothetical protein
MEQVQRCQTAKSDGQGPRAGEPGFPDLQRLHEKEILSYWRADVICAASGKIARSSAIP